MDDQVIEVEVDLSDLEPDYNELTLPDATPEEVSFWERIYLKVVETTDDDSGAVARSWATGAVVERRQVFPHLTKKENA